MRTLTVIKTFEVSNELVEYLKNLSECFNSSFLKHKKNGIKNPSINISRLNPFSGKLNGRQLTFEIDYGCKNCDCDIGPCPCPKFEKAVSLSLKIREGV